MFVPISIGWGTLLLIGAVGWMVFWFGVHMSRALLRRSGRRLAGELGFQVGVSEKRARRGGEVEALVTISNTKGLGDVDVGLVCTESYDEETTDSEGKRTSEQPLTPSRTRAGCRSKASLAFKALA